jgi:acetoin utilization protein AcuC
LANLPVPPGLNDSEMAILVEDAILPLIMRFAPEAIVVQGGADALADDPMTKLELSNQALWRAIAAVKSLAPRLLVLGGVHHDERVCNQRSWRTSARHRSLTA